MAFEVTRTANPSTVIFSDLERGQFFRANTRTGDIFNRHWISVVLEAAEDVVALDKTAQEIPAQFGPKHMIKLRKVFVDDKNGNFTMNVDYLHDENEEPVYGPVEIKFYLDDERVKYSGQPHYVEVSVKTAMFSSDYFAPLGDDHY